MRLPQLVLLALVAGLASQAWRGWRRARAQAKFAVPSPNAYSTPYITLAYSADGEPRRRRVRALTTQPGPRG